MNMNIKVFVVVVTYNGKKWIGKCLKSLTNSLIPVEIIVVDNGSVDGTQQIIKQFPCVKFIRLEKNIGFGRANNKAIQMALDNNADYIFLLNQDAWIEENTIKELIRIAKESADYGVISPLHLNGSYTALDLNFSKHLVPETCPSFYSDLYFGKSKDIYEIKFVNAAAWLISRGCLKKVGLFEPLFFLYGEDNNYLQRVAYHGFKMGVTPRCTICHDREEREGKMNDSGVKIWERTESLIILLNILKSYKNCIAFFIKERTYLFLKKLYQRKFSETKYQITEIFFLIKNLRELKRLRESYKRNESITQ